MSDYNNTIKMVVAGYKQNELTEIEHETTMMGGSDGYGAK